MSQEDIHQVELLVAENKLIEAISALESAIAEEKSISTTSGEGILLIKKRMAQLDSDRIAGTISYDDVVKQSNLIAQSILNAARNNITDLGSPENSTQVIINQKGVNNVIIKGNFNGDIKL